MAVSVFLFDELYQEEPKHASNVDDDEIDSGRWSADWGLPGIELQDGEFLDVFSPSPSSDYSTPELLHSKIPVPPSPPPVQFWQPRRVESLPARRRRRRSIISAASSSPAVAISNSPPATCTICTDIFPSQRRGNPNCCDTDVCNGCMREMITLNINEGRPHISCPNPSCTQVLTRNEIVRHISDDTTLLNKYERFRLNFEEDGTKKTCPNCCLITERDIRHIRKPTRDDLQVTCKECEFSWCFRCHAPWHEGVNCSSYRKGDKQFKNWTKKRTVNFTPNCQRCPTCDIFIQRSTGCDMMTCNQCNQVFCYKCGGRFHSFPGLGDHYKRIGIFGCSYNYKPDQPGLRKLLRGGYIGTKLIALTGYPVLFVGGCAVVLIGGAFVLPVYGCYKLHKHLKRQRRMRNRIQRRQRH